MHIAAFPCTNNNQLSLYRTAGYFDERTNSEQHGECIDTAGKVNAFRGRWSESNSSNSRGIRRGEET